MERLKQGSLNTLGICKKYTLNQASIGLALVELSIWRFSFIGLSE
jgi:hypothetical protein